MCIFIFKSCWTFIWQTQSKSTLLEFFKFLLGCSINIAFLSIKVKSFPANISTLFQRWLLVDTTSWRGATSNQRWNNVVYFTVGIYNVEQCWIIVVYFNLDINNFRQRRNNVVVFHVDMNNVGKCQNNIVKMTISKKSKTSYFNRIQRNSKF